MSDITHATLFTTALCNLNCAYCYICKDKDGNLKQIDDDIAREFANDSYINQILAYGDDIQEKLDSLTLWGGEPFLHMERFTSRIDKWFEAFPNINKIDTSTNFTIPNQYKIVENLLAVIAKQPLKEPLFFDLQISIDGYEEMNDVSRGTGVTQRFLENFRGLCHINYDRSKIRLYVHTKPTLSKATFHFLDTPEQCEKWFKFFDDEMFKPYSQAGQPFEFSLSLYNLAQPTEWTKEDGIYFAQVMRSMQSVDIKKYAGWRCYTTGVPIAGAMCHVEMNQPNKRFCDKMCGGGCGAFTHSIVPIPNGMYTMCHRGLFDEYVDYCNNVSKRDELNGLSEAYFNPRNAQEWVYDLETFKKMNRAIAPLDDCPHQSIYTDWVIFIREYAKAGLIDKKWEDIKMIDKVIPYFMENSYCVQDGYIFSGSWVTVAHLEIPVLFNGAMDVALDELEKIKREKGEL